MKINLKNIVALSIMSLVLGLSGCGKENIKVSLPESNELAQAGFNNVKQADELEGAINNAGKTLEGKTDKYVLTDYTINENSIEYTYTDTETQNKKITLYADKVSETDFYNSLPTNTKLTDAIINGNNCIFLERTVRYVTDGYQPTELDKQNIEKGTTEIKYGNSVNALLPIQRIYWYDYNSSMGYNVEVIGQYYSLEDLSTYVQSFMDNAK